MNEILNTNPLFFALSVFSLIFYDFSKDYKILDYYYPKRFDIKANNIRQIEIIDNSKKGNSLYDYAVFKFSKQGELEYCGTNEPKPGMHTTRGYFDTEHLYDSNGILIGDKLNPKLNGDKYYQKYNVLYSENPKIIEFSYKNLFNSTADTSNSNQKIYLGKDGKVRKYIVSNTHSLGSENLYDLHEEFYSYSNDNLLNSVKVHSILNHRERNYSYFITYNDNGKIAEIIGGAITSPSDTANIEKITDWKNYTYDKDNKQVKVYEKTNISQKPMTVNEYFYDTDGHLVKEIYKSSLFPEIKEFHYFTYKNDLISTRIETNSKGDTISNFTYQYEFYD